MGNGPRFHQLGVFTDVYLLLKTVHLLGVILVLGNVIVTVLVKANAAWRGRHDGFKPA